MLNWCACDQKHGERGNNMNKEIKIGTVTKKDMYNASVSAKGAEEMLEKPLKIKAIGTFPDNIKDKETGETKAENVTFIVTDKDEVISTPSPVVNEALARLIDIFGTECIGQTIKLVAEKSNAGRTYYTVKMV